MLSASAPLQHGPGPPAAASKPGAHSRRCHPAGRTPQARWRGGGGVREGMAPRGRPGRGAADSCPLTLGHTRRFQFNRGVPVAACTGASSQLSTLVLSSGAICVQMAMPRGETLLVGEGHAQGRGRSWCHVSAQHPPPENYIAASPPPHALTAMVEPWAETTGVHAPRQLLTHQYAKRVPGHSATVLALPMTSTDVVITSEGAWTACPGCCPPTESVSTTGSATHTGAVGFSVAYASSRYTE